MATVNSDQKTKLRASPKEVLDPNELGGEVRVARFSFDNSSGTAVSGGDVVRLTDLPGNARVISGEVEVTDAFATNANIEIGTSSDADKYGPSIDVDATGVTAIADTVAHNGLLATETTDGGEELIATFDTAGGNGAFEGYILFVKT